MSRLDKLFGLDHNGERHKHAPLWKRAAWHAFKKLVRTHPGAAISAVGTGAGYAIKHGVEEGAKALQEKVGKGGEALKQKLHAVGTVLNQAAPDLKSQHTGDALAAEAKIAEPRENSSAANVGSDRAYKLSQAQKEELIQSLPPEDRRALADLARKE